MRRSGPFSCLLALCLLLPAALALVPDWTPPLSTRGRYIVDATGARFKLKAANWHGASGTWEGSGDKNDDTKSHSGENSHVLALGLQYVPIDEMLDSFEAIGINSIRLPFSNEMIHDTSVIPDDWIAANPQLKGKTPLEVYDAVVAALTARRFAVIINNHTNKSRWCCGVNDGNERWNESQSEDAWIADWISMVQRYKSNPRVVGADLYNEVRRDLLNDPNWGDYDAHDWYLAAHHAGDRILTEANKDILIVIEGINWFGLPVDGFPHGRPTLDPAHQLSHTLVQPDKLVYSAHFYGYTGPNHSGATGIGETSDPRYQDLSKADLFAVYNSSAAFVALSDDSHFTHPLWMSEFGSGIDTGDAQKPWWFNTVEFLTTYDIDFSFWPLVGFSDSGNNWALQAWTRASPAVRHGLLDFDDWRRDSWLGLVNATAAQPPADVPAHWRILNLDAEDYVKSITLLARGGDWDSGARKGVCPDGLRLLGLSSSGRARGICADTPSAGGATWGAARDTEVVTSETHVAADWASGFTKYQCADDSFAIGYALRGAKVSSVLCAKADRVLGQDTSRTVWFNQGDQRADGNRGGDWAVSQYKGQCASDEHVAGVAFSTAWARNGSPAALLCRK